MASSIATHKQPDPDVLVALWLASRYLFAGQRPRILFVGRKGQAEVAADADCVVDVGCTYDLKRLRFDHKPPAVADRHRTCASRMLWDYLLAEGHKVHHLAPLIDVVHEGDSARRRGTSASYQQSCEKGLHALHRKQRKQGLDDHELWKQVRAWLNRYERSRRQESAEPSPRWQRYGRGRVYLQMLENADASSAFEATVLKDPYHKHGFGRWDKGWGMADRLAEDWRVDRKTIRDYAHFAFIVDSIVMHCGNDVRVPILSERWRLSEKVIGQISRSSGERQQYEIDEVKAGRRALNTKKQNNVYDTVGYYEIINRLQLAKGAIKKGLELVKSAPDPPAPWVRPILQDIAEICVQLHVAVYPPHQVPEGREASGATMSTTSTGSPAESIPHSAERRNNGSTWCAEARGLFNNSRRRLAKNLRDLPRLHPRAYPEPKQPECAAAYVTEIQQMLEPWL